MSADFDAADAEPSNTGYSIAWVAYALQATGVFGFVLGPLVSLVISYGCRDAPGLLASHHRWLIRTFWWTALGYVVCLGLIVGAAWPMISEVVREAIRTGGNVQEFSFGIAWDVLFATVGAAMAGGLGLLVVWIWNLYRLMRGGFLLAERSPAP